MSVLCRRYPGRGRVRGSVVVASAVLAGLVAMAATGCTGLPGGGGDESAAPPGVATSRHPSAAPSPASATLNAGRAGVLLADADRPSELSVQVSRALYS